MKFIHSVRFMGSSLSSLINNLTEGLQKGQCKGCNSSREYMTPKEVLLTFTCLECNKNFDEYLSKIFKNTYQFCNGDINISCIMLWKSLYEYMGGWQKFNETSLPTKKEFHSNLTMKSITDAD